MKALTTPTFFRYSFIRNAEGSLRDEDVRLTVHGLVFTFGEPKQEDKEAVREAVEDVWKAYERFEDVPSMEITDGEEKSRVASSETVGIGFYYVKVLVNDQEVGKSSHKRFGYIFTFVSRLLKRVSY